MMLVHLPTSFFFIFDLDNKRRHHCTFSPGDSIFEEQQFPGDWRYQLEYVKAWLSYVKREYEAPDGEQYRALDARIGYVIEATERLGRLDWRMLFIGAVIETAISHAVAAPAFSDLLNFALRGLAAMFGGTDLPALP